MGDVTFSGEIAEFIARAREWAVGRPDVRGLAVVGSWARGLAAPESDLDLVLVCDRPATYVEGDNWARELGAVGEISQRTWGPVIERRWRTASGLEVDFGLAEGRWASADPLDPGTARVVADGFVLIHDPNGGLARLAGAVANINPASAPPPRDAMEDAELEAIARAVLESVPPRAARMRVIAVDGLAGAGKSTFAERLSRHLGAPLVPSDDFASWEDPLGWGPRFIEQVLDPLARGEHSRYQRYDWASRSLAEWREIPATGVVVIEGVSTSRAAFRPYLTYTAWVQTPRDERLRRGIERDGEAMRTAWIEWMRAEDEYVRAERPATHADVIIDGTRRR